MQQKPVSREGALLRLTFCAIIILLMLCLLALLVFAVARTVTERDPSESVPDPADAVQQEDQQPSTEDTGGDSLEQTEQGGEVPAGTTSAVLGESADRGQAYIDQMVFFGESTTAHLRSRGVLSGGKSTDQVWADASYTMMLSLEILHKRIIYPETGEEMTVEQAAALKKPRFVVLAFGVNGLSGFVNNPKLYEASYAKLISAIQAASPETVVLLQTVYPVGRSYADAQQVNEKIAQLNEWLPEIAQKNGAYLVDTASCLRDGEGMLRTEFAQADGLHLTAAAYREILAYMRTHAYPE